MSRVVILPGNLWQEWHLLDTKRALTSLRVNLRFWLSYFLVNCNFLKIGPPVLSVQRMKGGQRLSWAERNGRKPIKLKCSQQQAWETWPLLGRNLAMMVHTLALPCPLQRSTPTTFSDFLKAQCYFSWEIRRMMVLHFRKFQLKLDGFTLLLKDIHIYLFICLKRFYSFEKSWEWMSSWVWGNFTANCLQINR